MTVGTAPKPTADRVPGLGRIAAGMMPFSVAVQVCSFASSIALAQVLGASGGTDAYFLGLSVPVLTYSILLAGVRLGAIPVLTNAQTGRLAPTTGGDLVLAVGVASAVLVVVATAAAVIALPAFVADERVSRMAVTATIELAPLGVFGALTGALGAILAVQRRFIWPVAVMAIEPLLKTVLTVTVGRRIGINALIIGNLVGSAAACGVLMFVAYRAGLRLRSDRPDMRFLAALGKMSLPLVVAQSVLQVNPLIDRTMATALGRGEVTTLELGLRLFVVPTTLLTSTLIGPITATWAARFRDGGWPALAASARRATLVALIVAPPLVALGLLLRHDLIAVVYGGGAYSSSVAATASVFGMLLLGLPAQVLVVSYAAMFVVRGATSFPMVIAGANVILNVCLNFVLRPVFGVAGIALSTALTFSILVVAYAVRAHRRWGAILDRADRGRIGRGLVATGVLIGAALLLRELPAPPTRAGDLAHLVFAGVGGAGAFLLALVGRDPRGARLRLGIGHAT